MPPRAIEDFIAHGSAASPSERANSQPFLLDLCDALGVPRPDPHPDHGYFFEFAVTDHHADGTTSEGRDDLYMRAGLGSNPRGIEKHEPSPGGYGLSRTR